LILVENATRFFNIKTNYIFLILALLGILGHEETASSQSVGTVGIVLHE